MSASAVYDAIRQEKTIQNVSVYEPINLAEVQHIREDVYYDIDYAVTFESCYIRKFNASDLIFRKPMSFWRCTFVEADFSVAYVNIGLTIDQCHFKHDLRLLDMGGHTFRDRLLLLQDTVFDGYVDMFDAIFEGPVEVRRCTFKRGTNLLGNKSEPFAVHFKGPPPIIEDNEGQLDLNGNPEYRNSKT